MSQCRQERKQKIERGPPLRAGIASQRASLASELRPLQGNAKGAALSFPNDNRPPV